MKKKIVIKINLLLIIFVLMLIGSCTVFKRKIETSTYSQHHFFEVLVFVAHYDDETILAPVLLPLIHHGAKIHLVYVTAGEGGKDQRAMPTDFINEESRKEHLKLTRLFEIRSVERFLPMERYQVNAPDVPLRIPEAGYPNPAGRPSTDGEAFLAKEIWSAKDIKQQWNQWLKNKSWNPTFIFTLGLDKGVTHAHHQGAHLLLKQWLEEETRIAQWRQLKGVYEVLETPSYPLEKFKPREVALAYYPSSDLVSQLRPIYQAHQSQLVCHKSEQELLNTPVLLSPVNIAPKEASLAGPNEQLFALGAYLPFPIKYFKFNRSDQDADLAREWSSWMNSLKHY